MMDLITKIFKTLFVKYSNNNIELSNTMNEYNLFQEISFGIATA